jgi:GNAT superfamily N-acetyltransferase
VGLRWVREDAPVWDDAKARVIGGAPEGAFVLPFRAGDALPGDWWHVTDDDGAVVGFGRLDTTWGGDAEILLAADPAHQQAGVGSFVLARLEDEAEARGINYVRNTIRAEHPDRDLVHDWLVVRGFRGTVDGDLHKRVGSTRGAQTRGTPGAPASYDVTSDPGGQAPGREDAGGYVNVEDHRY